MKAQDIILHLIEWLPQYSSRYSTKIAPQAVSVSGETVTMSFASAHGVIDGGIIAVDGALVENPIDTIDDSGDNVLFTTTLEHDITFGWREGITEQVNLTSSTDPSIDGDYDLVSSDNRDQFEIATFPDTALADVVLNEPKEVANINGRFNITLIDETSFSYELESAFAVDPVIKASTVNVQNYVRISGGLTIDRLEKAYNEQPKQELWAFVVLGDDEVNKDRNVQDDPTLQQGNLNDWGVLLMQEFSVVLFVPCKDSDGNVELTGRNARDIIEEERVSLYQALLGTEFDTGFVSRPNSVSSPLGGRLVKDANAYIIFEFRFQQVAEISNGDVINKAKTVALRNVSIDYLDYFRDSGNIIMEADIETDVSPVTGD